MIKPEKHYAIFLSIVFVFMVVATVCVNGNSSAASKKAEPNLYDVLTSQRIETFIANAREVGHVQAETITGEPENGPRAMALNKKTGWTYSQTRAITFACGAAVELQPDETLAALYNLPPMSKAQKALIAKHQPALGKAIKIYKDSMASTLEQREKDGHKPSFK